MCSIRLLCSGVTRNMINKIFGDWVIFTFIQFLFLVFFMFVFMIDKKFFKNKNKNKSSLIVEVKRGEISWGYFHFTYGLLSILILEIINTTEAFKGYKTLITITDLSMLLYLCFFSSWFRNKIVGVFSKSKELVEK